LICSGVTALATIACTTACLVGRVKATDHRGIAPIASLARLKLKPKATPPSNVR
jgi:hypothetical protein